MLKVIPRLDKIPAGRWEEGQTKRLEGLAFKSGLRVLAEDWPVSPIASYDLPVDTITRTYIDLTIPEGSLGDLRGVRRIRIENPDGGRSRAERIDRINRTIVVKCAAFRVTTAQAWNYVPSIMHFSTRSSQTSVE
jgi:hypothetical protein